MTPEEFQAVRKRADEAEKNNAHQRMLANLYVEIGRCRSLGIHFDDLQMTVTTGAEGGQPTGPMFEITSAFSGKLLDSIKACIEAAREELKREFAEL